MKQCLGCLAQLEEDVEVCPYCGYEFKYVKRPNNVQGANIRRRLSRTRQETIPPQSPAPEPEMVQPAPQEIPYVAPYPVKNPVPPMAGPAAVKKAQASSSVKRERVSREEEEEMEQEEAPSRRGRSSRSSGPLGAIQNTFGALISKGSRKRNLEDELEDDEYGQEDPYDDPDLSEEEERQNSIPALLSSLFGNTGNNVTRGVFAGLILLFALVFLVLLIRGIFFRGGGGDHLVNPVQQESNQSGETGQADASLALADADEDIKTLVVNYFNAYNNKDLEAARQILDDLPESEEQSILNSAYDHYAVTRIYSAKDASNAEAVILALYTYQLAGIDTPLPASSWLYAKKDGEGKWRILHPTSIGEDFRSFILGVQSTDKAKALLESVRQEYDSAVSGNAKLQAALAKKQGSSSSASSSSTSNNTRETVTATTNVNVRATPNSEGEIVGSVKEGQTLVKTGVDGEWIKVIYKNQPSYVFAEFFVDSGTGTGSGSSSGNAGTGNTASSGSGSAEETQESSSEESNAQEDYSEEDYSEEGYSEEEYYEEEYYEDYSE